ncbi:MAG: hypothetical protein ACI383_11400, partial [Rummeliibacillus sp.]
AFVNFKGTSAFVLELNGHELTPSTLFSQNDGFTMPVIVNIPANSTLKLKLKSKNEETIISCSDSVSASMTIVKISES